MIKGLLLFMLPLLFSCSNGNEKKQGDIPNHEYSEIVDKKIKWNDIFFAKSNEYYIYCYFSHCTHCHSIKNEVIHIALNSDKDIRFCEDDNTVISDCDLNQTIGKSKVSDVFIKGFPSVIKITNHKISHNICGATKVIQFIRQ